MYPIPPTTLYQLLPSGQTRSIEQVIAKLIELGEITQEEADRASRAADSNAMRVDEFLMKFGLIHEEALATSLAAALDLDLLDPSDLPSEPLLLSAFPPIFIENARVMPIKLTDDTVVIAMVDPLNDLVAGAIETSCSRRVVRKVVTTSVFDAIFKALYAIETTVPMVEEPGTPASEAPIKQTFRWNDIRTTANHRFNEPMDAARRFENLKVGDQLMQEYVVRTQRSGSPILTVKNQEVWYFIVTDLWFDPVVGQARRHSGEKVAVQRIGGAGEPVGRKQQYTVRGLAAERFKYADCDYISYCKQLRSALTEGKVVGIAAGRAIQWRPNHSEL